MNVYKTMTNQIEVDKELFTALNESKSGDATRFFMTQPYYDKENNRISATDGRRLFVYNFTEENDLQEGFYTAVKQGKKFYFFRLEDMEGQYPNIDRVMPDYTDTVQNTFAFCSKLGNCAPDLFRLFTIAGPINPDFLKPLYGIEVTVDYCDMSNKAIVIHNYTSWKYIIMPMQTAKTDEAHEEAMDIFKRKFVK